MPCRIHRAGRSRWPPCSRPLSRGSIRSARQIFARPLWNSRRRVRLPHGSPPPTPQSRRAQTPMSGGGPVGSRRSPGMRPRTLRSTCSVSSSARALAWRSIRPHGRICSTTSSRSHRSLTTLPPRPGSRRSSMRWARDWRQTAKSGAIPRSATSNSRRRSAAASRSWRFPSRLPAARSWRSSTAASGTPPASSSSGSGSSASRRSPGTRPSSIGRRPWRRPGPRASRRSSPRSGGIR